MLPAGGLSLRRPDRRSEPCPATHRLDALSRRARSAIFAALWASSSGVRRTGRGGRPSAGGTLRVDAAGQPEWHIAKADGTLPPPPLNGDGHTWHHGDGLLYRIVSQGGQMFEDPRFPDFKSAMPAFGERLSHEDIVEVLTYIKSLWEGKTSRGLSIQEAQALASEVDPFPPSAQ